MTLPRRVSDPVDRAEGDVYYPGCEEPIAYNTFLAGPDGVHIHFWIHPPEHGAKMAKKLKSFASYFRDIVSCSYSDGRPSSYWAHNDMKPDVGLP